MKKKICLIYCGGTIGMVRKTDGLLVPAGRAEDIIALVPGVKEMADIDFKFVVDIDSTNIHPGIWTRLAQTVYDNYDNCDGFVIAHGTDTMAYTASALSFALQNLNKPIVLTGAQKSIFDLASDAQNNLINAVKVALLDLPEVCVVFGSRILRGNRAQKVSEKKMNAFWSPVALPLGCVALDPEIDSKQVWKWRSNDLEFKPNFDREVVFYQLFPGLDGKYIELAVNGGCKGIILNAYGAGNVPNGEVSLLPVIKKAVKNNVPVVVATQCVEGSTRMIYEVGYSSLDVGAIPAFDMTSEAAATKLMWILGQTKDLEAIKEMMRTNFCGEITAN